MLCDDIMRHGITNPVFDSKAMRRVIDRIGRAVKFDLAPDFGAVADELASNPGEVLKAIPFCRLPYPELWIEVAQQHRQHFVNGEPIKQFQGRPRRVGFLLTATNDRLSAWKTHLFWSLVMPQHLEEFGCNAATFAMLFDVDAGFAGREGRMVGKATTLTGQRFADLPQADQDTLSRIICPDMPDYGYSGYSDWVLLPPRVVDRMADMGRLDWAGEPAYIEATLALLNTKNASDAEYQDNDAFNRRRASRGQHPLASHYRLRIHPRQMARIRETREAERNAELRAHFVRGHWKVRRTGIFFWRPFLRGDRGAGFVTKDYEVAS